MRVFGQALRFCRCRPKTPSPFPFSLRSSSVPTGRPDQSLGQVKASGASFDRSPEYDEPTADSHEVAALNEGGSVAGTVGDSMSGSRRIRAVPLGLVGTDGP